MVLNKINGFPGFLMGAPGALEISRRREIALSAPARWTNCAVFCAFPAREAVGTPQ